MIEPFQCDLVLLAAGGSRRMGQPKQLLTVYGKALVRHMAEIALTAPVNSVVVVLGAEAERITPLLGDLPLKVVTNPDWESGLSSSLRVGVETALTYTSDLSAVLVCLADQPNLSQEHLRRMIARYKEGSCTAVASLAGDAMVPPMLFDSSWFSKLRAIKGDIGARAILREHPGQVATVPIDSVTDLDTPEDYAKFVG